MNTPIEVWAPKYSTDSVLIGTHHVKDGLNTIVFTKANHLKGGVYSIDGKNARTYPKQPNGKGFVYVVPFIDLKCEKQPTKI